MTKKQVLRVWMNGKVLVSQIEINPKDSMIDVEIYTEASVEISGFKDTNKGNVSGHVYVNSREGE